MNICIISIILSLILSGCNPFFLARPDSEKIVKAGWAEEKPKVAIQPLYCYRTLGEPMCYNYSLNDSNHRIVGHYEENKSRIEK